MTGQNNNNASERILKGLSQTKMTVKAILLEEEIEIEKLISLTLGQVLTFQCKAKSMPHLSVGEKKIARGKAVNIDGHYGLQIEQLLG